MPNSLPPRWSVRTLILWLIIACLLPAVGGTVAFFAQMYRSGRTQLESNTLQVSRALVSAVDSQLSRAQIVGEALATSSSLARRDFPDFQRRSLDLLQRENAGAYLILSDALGRQIVNTLRPYGDPLTLHGSLEHVGRVFATGQAALRMTDGFKTSVDVPVRIDGKLAYVVSVIITPELLQRILVAQHLPDDWLAGIFDQTGTTLARNKLQQDYLGKKGAPGFVANLLKILEATLETKTKEGIPALVMYSTSPTSHWVVGIAIPRASLEADLLRNIVLLALGIGILFAISIALAWLTGSRISRSINALREPALALERGEVVPISNMHFHEAHEVAKAMARTAGLLARRTAELKDLNLDLEAKVVMRSRSIDELYHLLQEVMEALPFGVAVYDEQQDLILHNQLYADMLDLPDDLLACRPARFADIMRHCFDRGDFGDVVFEPVLQRFVGMMTARESVCFERPQANGVFLEIRGLPIMAGATLLTYTDISAHKLAEKVLDDARKAADAATVAKGAFLASMSHEIRTPMNAIIGLAYLLGKARLPEQSDAMVRKITAASRSLLAIINDILDFSKIEAGQIKLEKVRFSLDSVLDNLSSIMYASAADKDIELVITPPRDSVNWLEGDALRLEQILINLVGNGIKFTERGHVELGISVIAESGADVTLRFAVHDTGVGIALDKQGSIFDAFSQADTSTTRRFGGTGLGLTISHRFVTILGGEMGVNSVPGTGSEFWFSLTFRKSPGVTVSVPELARLDLLIADDNAIARDALHRVALGLGWTAHIVSSGAAALEYVVQQASNGGDRRPADVILLDWKMPGMDGLAAARAMREAVPEGAHAPVVIMVTGHSSEELQASADSELADAVLNKPVTASVLYNAVASVLQTRSGTRPADALSVQRRLEGIRLLVADDSEINREVATRILEDEGANIVCVENGRQAVDWLIAHPGEVDVVLMDVQMPVMDGHDATRLIRAAPSLSTLPVIALTAGAFKTEEQAARMAGMSGFIAKPFDVDATIALILQHAHRAPRTAPVGDAPAPAIDLAPGAYPGIALSRGLSLWKDADVYCRYLRMFARDYGASAAQLGDMAPAPSAALLHKLIGAAASLALEEVVLLARETDRLVRAGADAADSLVRLGAAITTALASIDRLLHATEKTAAPAAAPDLTLVATLLGRAIEAFDSDNPAVIEPVLVQMATLLPQAQLAALHASVESYDFRAGEAAVRSLAADLDIPIGN